MKKLNYAENTFEFARVGGFVNQLCGKQHVEAAAMDVKCKHNVK